jgi:PKD repeat protein
LAPIAQPTADKLVASCIKDTFFFDDFSVLNHANASWSWNIPQASYINNTQIRNPKVLFPGIGTYTATLTVTNGNNISNTKQMIVQVTSNECVIDTTAGNALQVTTQGAFGVTNNLSLPNTNTFTMMAWVKGNGAQADYAGILSIQGGVHLNVRAANSADSSEIGYHHPNGAWWYSSGLYLMKNEWTHIALVVEPTQISIYKNGVKATHTGVTIQQLNLGPKFLVGSMLTREYDRCFKGNIDEVAVYNYALTTNEIRDMMHLTKQNPNYLQQANPNLKAYYQFNELTSNKCYDNIGGAHLQYQNCGKTISSAPIGGGISYRINGINAAGANSFTGTGVTIDFSNGTNPNGDIIVNALNVKPDVQPGTFPIHQKYFIVNNYGTNKTISPLTGITIANLPTLSPGTASDFELYKRGDNSDGNTWGSVIDVADNYNANGNNSSLTFSANNNITSFGQFCLNSKIALTPLDIDVVTNKIDLIVYPNPAKNNCFVMFNNKLSAQNATVFLYDITGKVLMANNVELKSGNNRLMINLPEVSTGTYQLQLKIGSSRFEKQLLIK